MVTRWLHRATLMSAIFGIAAIAMAAEEPATKRPGAASQPVEKYVLPKPTGPYAVGRITVHVEFAPPAEKLKARTEPRLVPIVQIWYPARAGAEGKPAPWLPADRARLEDKGFLKVLLPKHAASTAVDIFKVMAAVVVHAREQVPLADSPKPFPVLIFAAGSQTIPSTYSSLVEDLASRGYVVVGHGPTVMGLETWKDDLTRLLDQLKVWNTTRQNMFFGRLDLDRLGAFGHSFGASAISTIAAHEKRLKAIVLIDGGGQPQDARAMPILILNSEGAALARRTPDAAKEAALKRQNDYSPARPGIRVILQGAVHMSFSDMAVINAFAVSGDGKAYIDASRAIIAEFFGQYLLGQRSALLEKGSEKYPLAKIERPR